MNGDRVRAGDRVRGRVARGVAWTFLVALAVHGPAAVGDGKRPSDQAARDLEKLTGDWHVITVVRHGDKEREAGGSHDIVIKGEQFEEWVEGFLIYKGTLRLDPSAKPRRIDITVTGGGSFDKGKPGGCDMVGIYEFRDRGPVLNLSRPAGKIRPTEFGPYDGPRGEHRGRVILEKPKK